MLYKSKICQVPTDQILTRLIHASVFSLIELTVPKDGTLKPQSESEANDILRSVFRGKKGEIVVLNDGVRILIEGTFEDRPVLRCAIRDRQLDGTDKSSPLTFFPNTDPACNRLPAPVEEFLAAELSIYSWDPNTYLDGLDVEGSVGHFIADPDFYLWKNFDPKLYFSLFEQAFFLGRAPWQSARPMSKVPAFFVEQSVKLLREIGYHRVDAVPSWFNVARFFQKLGFKFTYGEHELAFEGIEEGLKEFAAHIKSAKGKGLKSLSRSQEAWLVALQNVPEKYLPEGLKLPCRWPVTHTNMYWVRMHMDLNSFPEPAAVGGTLMERIRALRDAATANATKIVLHVESHCPCTSTLGASSPAATGPAATPTADDKPGEKSGEKTESK